VQLRLKGPGWEYYLRRRDEGDTAYRDPLSKAPVVPDRLQPAARRLSAPNP
jgi:hypothetical protein